MEIFVSIERQAAVIPDPVAKLRFLRAELHRKELRRKLWGISTVIAAGLTAAGVAFLGLRWHAPAPSPKLAATPRAGQIPASESLPTPTEKFWIVERREAYSVYSNGLQVRADYLTQSVPRSYRTYSRPALEASAARQAPAGIVYHTTESLLLPLEAGGNGNLVRTREDLLNHVRHERLYNFVIDRFGQVFRVVPEDEVAYHAGHSVWANTAEVYVDLNDSFLGVSFEARTGEGFEPSTAQIRAGHLLTDVLRAQYQIPEANCVTHAQVSVNPDNMRLGYHTDWGANFPFRELGLSGGYQLPIAALEIFGFEYDRRFLDALGGRPWEGLTAAEDHLAQNGWARGMTTPEYRHLLQQQYRLNRSNAHANATRSDRT